MAASSFTTLKLPIADPLPKTSRNSSDPEPSEWPGRLASSSTRRSIGGADQDIGIGEAVGRYLQSCALEFPDYSLVLQAYQQDVPFTVHAAYGTDIIHNHPRASGASLGKCTEIDYRIFTQEVSRLHDGGVFINVGSAVLLPEVFLKAVSAVRNSGQELSGFSTANFDFLQHYRPTQNVVNRPVEGDGKGFAITGHHELTIPLLAGILLNLNEPTESTRSGA